MFRLLTNLGNTTFSLDFLTMNRRTFFFLLQKKALSDNKNYLSKILIFLRGENYCLNEERKRKIFLKIILCLRKMDSKSRICKFSREKRNRRKILNSFIFFFLLK